MPAVVAAFKNLIRKHHHPQQRHPIPDEQPDAARHPPQQLLYNQQPRPESPKQKADPSAPSSTLVPEITQAHDTAVPEDHHPKVKMPTYKGLENFKLLDKMGDGAFSNVYKAIDLTTNEKVAVKVVRKFELNASQAGEKHLSPHFKKRPRATEVYLSEYEYVGADVFTEVQIMRGVNHPSIVKLLSFSESLEHYFLVLELMDGGELFHQIVKLTYFSENLSRHVILQVAQGIRYLHEERGVVHRDIKPENLLFERIPIIPSKSPLQRPYDEEKEDEGDFIPGVGGGGIGRIKIADFGLSKVVWNEETMTPCGTVGYTAPEIVKDERYSKSVDMWALGCVLYTLLCGFPPFYDESINVLTEKVARGYYTFLSPWWDDISGSAKDLIQHLLCTNSLLIRGAQLRQHRRHRRHPLHIRENLLIRRFWQPLEALPDARSPGLASLKEAFDVTYAVHRMEEEGARRRAYNGRGGAGTRGFLQGLNEEDEVSDADDENVVNEARQKRGEALDGGSIAGAKVLIAPRVARGSVTPGGNLGVGRARQRDRGHHGSTKGFELDLDNATLLGRRHKKNAGAAVNTTNLNSLPPGSPMRVA
ncbi:kinase-like domain-containing protein [Pisolithus albus]|nr:kinase-like domain-containing protein [Pisolithus albus]